MNLLIISNTCSLQKYQYIFETREKKYIDPSQKFFYQLFEGTSNNKNFKTITYISSLPISASVHKKKKWDREIEKKGKFKFIYHKFINRKIICFFASYYYIKKEINIWQKKNKNDGFIIVDGTNLVQMLALLHSRKKVKKVALVTDVPNMITVIGHKKISKIRYFFQLIYDNFTLKVVNKFDGYIFLTESMNELLNPQKKPYIVIEGSVDTSKVYKQKQPTDTFNVVYAGGLYKSFGIDKLINSFSRFEENDKIKLFLYGNGPIVENYSKQDYINDKVQYMGVVSSDEIVKIEAEADLLINPRPSNLEFTKYSFPSKTLEYMSSGTAFLTTKLKGIGKEYFKYLLVIDDETEYGIYKSIRNAYLMEQKELNELGSKAKQFVETQKNSYHQCVRLYNFLMELDNYENQK